MSKTTPEAGQGLLSVRILAVSLSDFVLNRAVSPNLTLTVAKPLQILVWEECQETLAEPHKGYRSTGRVAVLWVLPFQTWATVGCYFLCKHLLGVIESHFPHWGLLPATLPHSGLEFLIPGATTALSKNTQGGPQLSCCNMVPPSFLWFSISTLLFLLCGPCQDFCTLQAVSQIGPILSSHLQGEHFIGTCSAMPHLLSILFFFPIVYVLTTS